MPDNESMNTCQDMNPTGAVAIANWGGDNAAIYYADKNGGLRERTYKDGVWDGGLPADALHSQTSNTPLGITSTPLAVMQWFDEPSPGENMVCVILPSLLYMIREAHII